MMDSYIIILFATGLGVGLATGVLGVGGCFLMVPVQYWLLLGAGLDPATALRIAFGTSLATVLPTALSGAVGHWRQGQMNFTAGLSLGLSGLVGGILGGFAASIVPEHGLRMVFSTVVILGALRLLWFQPCPRDICRINSIGNYIVWGFPIGVLSGLSGIGGGVLLVPVMVVFLGLEMHLAVGTSTLAIALMSLGGITSYMVSGWGNPHLPSYSLGYVNLIQTIILALSSVPAAQIGARIAHRLPSETLKYLLAGLMIYVSLNMAGVTSILGLM